MDETMRGVQGFVSPSSRYRLRMLSLLRHSGRHLYGPDNSFARVYLLLPHFPASPLPLAFLPSPSYDDITPRLEHSWVPETAGQCVTRRGHRYLSSLVHQLVHRPGFEKRVPLLETCIRKLTECVPCVPTITFRDLRR